MHPLLTNIIGYRTPYTRTTHPNAADFVMIRAVSYNWSTGEPMLWMVTERKEVLNTAGIWEEEQRGSNKDPGYNARTRYASAEAAARAVEKYFEGGRK